MADFQDNVKKILETHVTLESLEPGPPRAVPGEPERIAVESENKIYDVSDTYDVYEI